MSEETLDSKVGPVVVNQTARKNMYHKLGYLGVMRATAAGLRTITLAPTLCAIPFSAAIYNDSKLISASLLATGILGSLGIAKYGFNKFREIAKTSHSVTGFRSNHADLVNMDRTYAFLRPSYSKASRTLKKLVESYDASH